MRTREFFRRVPPSVHLLLLEFWTWFPASVSRSLWCGITALWWTERVLPSPLLSLYPSSRVLRRLAVPIWWHVWLPSRWCWVACCSSLANSARLPKCTLKPQRCKIPVALALRIQDDQEFMRSFSKMFCHTFPKIQDHGKSSFGQKVANYFLTLPSVSLFHRFTSSLNWKFH